MTLYAYGVDCYYHVCLQGFLRASFNDVALQFHASSFIILSMPKTIDNIRSFLRTTTLWFSIALYGKIRIFAVTGINPSTHTKRSVMLSCLRKPKKLLKVNKICIMALTSMAWAVIIMSVHKGFLRTSASGM